MGTKQARRPDTWQAQKSAQTRRSILEAAVSCYVKLGYYHTTIGTIVKESSLSRGAVNHHFDSLFDLVRSAANYIKEKRIVFVHRRGIRLRLGVTQRIREAISDGERLFRRVVDEDAIPLIGYLPTPNAAAIEGGDGRIVDRQVVSQHAAGGQ